MRIFQGDTNIVYTDNVSYEEYSKKIMFCDAKYDESLVKYFDDITEEVLSEYFAVKKCPKKHIWYGDWENHRRIAVQLYKFYSYEIRWGYNYDFIPRSNNKQDKFVYHRTDKSVKLDVMDLYFNHIDYDADNLTHLESFNIRRKYELPVYGSSQEQDFAKKYIRDCIRTNIPFMQDFFDRYKSDRDVLSFLEHTIQNGNYFERYNYIWTKAFLYAKFHEMDKAIETMCRYYEKAEKEIPQQVIQKLKNVNNMD